MPSEEVEKIELKNKNFYFYCRRFIKVIIKNKDTVY